MAEEQVLKKEDNLQYKVSFWSSKKGTLTLTRSDLQFSSKNGKEMLRIPLGDVLSVNTEKLDFASTLFVIYKSGANELRAKFTHRDKRQVIFASASPSHFISWEQAINEARFGHIGGSNNISDLERLGTLRDKGVLTEAEFAAQKKAILSR